MDVPLNPLTKKEISKLANTLLVGSLFRPDILEKIKDPHDRITWVDSLAIAAWALAMKKAGMSITEIADNLGRSEQTIRKHLEGESEAGKIVKETYEKLLKGEEIVTIDTITLASKLNQKKGEIEKIVKDLEDNLEKIRLELEEIKKKLKEI